MWIQNPRTGDFVYKFTRRNGKCYILYFHVPIGTRVIVFTLLYLHLYRTVHTNPRPKLTSCAARYRLYLVR